MEGLDRDLWDQAAAGSDAAFAALFDRHVSAVYNYFFRRRGNWAEAEDLTSATFLEAWRRRDEVKIASESVRPWLLGVATNLLRNDIRSRRRRDRALQKVGAALDRPDDALAEDVAGRVDDQRRMAGLLDDLTRLPAEHQDAIALVVWSGLSYEEASVALAVPIGTVKSRVSRARRELAELSSGSGHDRGARTALARASTAQSREVEG